MNDSSLNQPSLKFLGKCLIPTGTHVVLHKCILCIHNIIYGLRHISFTIEIGVNYDNLCWCVSQSVKRIYTTGLVTPISKHLRHFSLYCLA